MERRIENSYGLKLTHLAEIQQLERLCNQAERLTMKLNWSVLEARPQDQINDFLCYDHDSLVGYLALYGFNQKEVEVSAITHPNYRRQGIFKQLLWAAAEELTARQTPEILFICERTSVSGKGCMHALGSNYDFSEFKMNLGTVPSLKTIPAELELRPAEVQDIHAMTQLDELCFGVDAEVARSWLEHDLAHDKRWMIVGLLAGQVIAKAAVIFGPAETMIVGVCVLPEFRGRGYGKAILAHTVRQVAAAYQGAISLEVACNNDSALLLYQHAGFEVVTAYDYYRLQVDQVKHRPLLT
jgi:ribosomal protein S18 acetylase RimI-like enzyme